MPQHTFRSHFTTNFEMSKAKFAKSHKITVVYVHGLYSSPWGRKGDVIKDYSLEQGMDFFRFELIGHGEFTADYEKADLNIWKSQLLEVIDEMVEGPILLVGASIGGWLSLLAAVERPDRIVGIVGLAAAPDFMADMEKYVLTAEQKELLKQKGSLEFPLPDFTYVLTNKLFESGRENMLLDKPIPVHCPVHLLQGTKDANIHPQKAQQIMEALESETVIIKMIKGSNHRLFADHDLAEACFSIKAITDSL